MRSILASGPTGPQLGIGTALSRQAARQPERRAISRGTRTITYGALDARANRRARALEVAGCGQDDIIAICSSDGFEVHEIAFAAWKIGATPAPLNPRMPKAEFEAVLKVMSPRMCITDASPDKNGGRQVAAPSRLAYSEAPLPDRVSRYWKANTSGGSTGTPKVALQHKPSRVSLDRPTNGLVLDDTMLMPAPLYHSAPFSFTNLALCWGAHVIEMERFDALETLQLVERHRVRWLYLVPTMMHRIFSLPESVRSAFDLSSLEMVLHMAAPCATWLKRAWIEWLGPDRIWETYGGTEAIGGTVIGGSEWLSHVGSVGRPYMGELKIIDETGRACEPGQVGQICFTSPECGQSAYHYRGQEDAPQSDIQSYGDMGWVDAEGFLYVADRRSDLILSGGANVYPAEVEAALDEHPAIASSVCVGLPDDDLGQRVHAILELQPGGEAPGAGELRSFLSERLAHYKLPFSYEVSALPLRNEAGKVRRSALRDERVALPPEARNFLPLRPRG